MTSRRDFIIAGAGALIAPSAACGVGAKNTKEPASSFTSDREAAWLAGFSGAALAIGASLDLRTFVTHPDGNPLTFSLNARSAPIAGVLMLSREGILTRIGHGDLAGIIIDADDGQ
ncbi:MAG: hypothetical protein GZ089_00110 [Aromatoleum sp.]|nr:hypothetical protein [Aromatoleum sp.]